MPNFHRLVTSVSFLLIMFTLSSSDKFLLCFLCLSALLVFAELAILKCRGFISYRWWNNGNNCVVNRSDCWFNRPRKDALSYINMFILRPDLCGLIYVAWFMWPDLHLICGLNLLKVAWFSIDNVKCGKWLTNLTQII